jgi:MFS family permease
VATETMRRRPTQAANSRSAYTYVPTHRAVAKAAKPMTVLVIVLTATFMQLLDVSIVNVAIPAVRADLAATPGQIQLVVAGYQLAFACSLLVGGRLGDLFGRRRMFMLGMAGFVLASVGCGMAGTGLALVVGRLLQGAFSGLMFPQVLSIVQVTFAPPQRPRAFGIYGATVGLATVLGPLLGGVMLDPLKLTWRWIFWVNVPVGVIALILCAWRIEESRVPEARRVDAAGGLFATVGLFLLVFPLIVGRDQHWPLWSFVAMAAAVPVLILFGVRQHRLERRSKSSTASEYRLARARASFAVRQHRPRSSALLPPALFKDRTFTIGLLLNLVFFTGVRPFFFVFILSLQVGFGERAIIAGLTTVPFAVASALGSSRSARLARRLRANVLLIGCVLLVVGQSGVIATLRFAGPAVNPIAFAPALAVAGFGMGLFVAPVTNLILAGVRTHNAGSASGVLATAQQVGGAAGVAVIGVIFFSLLSTNGAKVTADSQPDLDRALTTASLSRPTVGAIEAEVAKCFHDRVTADDSAAVPASCQTMTAMVRRVPDPGRRAAAERAVSSTLYQLRANDFNRSLGQSLYWQVGIIAVAGLLVLLLPRVRRDEAGNRRRT